MSPWRGPSGSARASSISCSPNRVISTTTRRGIKSNATSRVLTRLNTIRKQLKRRFDDIQTPLRYVRTCAPVASDRAAAREATPCGLSGLRLCHEHGVWASRRARCARATVARGLSDSRSGRSRPTMEGRPSTRLDAGILVPAKDAGDPREARPIMSGLAWIGGGLSAAAGVRYRVHP